MQQANFTANRLIRKYTQQNEPLLALVETPKFASFKQVLTSAIRHQYKEFVDNPPTDMVADDHLGKWLLDNITPISELLDATDVARYLQYCFIWGVKSQYKRFGFTVKADMPEMRKAGNFDDFGWSYDGKEYAFNLTNDYYIRSLQEQAEYLLHRSSIDETTREKLIEIVAKGKTAGLTIDEVADAIKSQIDEISAYRARTIARTETCQAMGRGNFAAMVRNGVEEKYWVAAGKNPCETCLGNVDDGKIPINERFSSGDLFEPAHPNDECYTEAAEINLSTISIWSGA